MYLPNHNGFIGVFDSGIGGLSVANAISERLPRHSLLYVADNAYAPYGPRPPAEILQRSRAITHWLRDRGCRLIVVACNTATAVAIDTLRREFADVPFVGLEPAVKPAARLSRVGVMATRATLDSERYRRLRARFLSDRHTVWESDCPGLVPLIERHAGGHAEIVDYLRRLFSDAPPLDAVVLGCTHYPLVEEDISAVLGPRVSLIDPAPAAAQQTARLARRHGMEASATARYDLYTTGPMDALARQLPRLSRLGRGRRCMAVVKI